MLILKCLFCNPSRDLQQHINNMFSPWFHTITLWAGFGKWWMHKWVWRERKACEDLGQAGRFFFSSFSPAFKWSLGWLLLEIRNCSSISSSVLLTSFKPPTRLKASSETQVMLLLLLLLWTQRIWGLLQAKCPLTLQRNEVDPNNHYRPGELSIDCIISATKALFQILNFKISPGTPILS